LFAGSPDKPVSVKLMRDKLSGFPVGYGFLEFGDEGACERVLNLYNGKQIPGTAHTYRLNWGQGHRRAEGAGGAGAAAGGGGQTGQSFGGQDFSVFVGDLSSEVDEQMLSATFGVRFSTITKSKVIKDPVTGMSKGFGFVHFASKEEADSALTTMNGVFIGSRAIRVNPAKKANDTPAAGAYGATAYGAPQAPAQDMTAYYAAQAAQLQQQQWAAYYAQQQQYQLYAQQAAAAQVAAQAAQAKATAEKDAADAAKRQQRRANRGRKPWEGNPTLACDINDMNYDYVTDRTQTATHMQGRCAPWQMRSELISQEHYNSQADDAKAGTAMSGQ
jgi:hypothetical protein